MEKVCDGVVALDGCAMGGVYGQLGCGALLRRAVAFYKMEERVAGLLGVGDLPGLIPDGECAGVAHLTAHLGVKRGAIQDDARAFLFFDNLKHGGVGSELIESNKLSLGIGRQAGDADDLFLLSGTRAFALLLHERLEAGGIHAQAGFAGHEFG